MVLPHLSDLRLFWDHAIQPLYCSSGDRTHTKRKTRHCTGHHHTDAYGDGGDDDDDSDDDGQVCDEEYC